MLLLKTQERYSDFRCPHCDEPLEWETNECEYDCMCDFFEEHEKECPYCNKVIKISFKVTTEVAK